MSKCEQFSPLVDSPFDIQPIASPSTASSSRARLRPRRHTTPKFDVQFHDDDDEPRWVSPSPPWLPSPILHPVTPPQSNALLDPTYSGSSDIGIPEDSNPWATGRKNNFVL